MVCKFRILSSDQSDFARELLVGSDQTFLDFHHCLQENLQYDPMQLASFYLTNSAWEKDLQITLMDMMDEEGDQKLIMEETKIGDHVKEVGQRLLYIFDFFSERSFFLELTELIEASTTDALPKVIYEAGNPPPQIDLGLDIPMDEDLLGDGFEDDGDVELRDDMDFVDGDEFADE